MSLLSTTVSAEPNPLHWKGHEKLLDNVGNGLVATQMTLGFIHAYKEHDLKCWAIDNAIGLAATEILKRAIHRTRPDKSDNKSFPSMHSMLGDVNVTSNWTYSITVSIGISRMGANKHFGSDVLGGIVIGELSRRICN